jgi:two-component system phosphate regulon sensor histidine kinase PhoR
VIIITILLVFKHLIPVINWYHLVIVMGAVFMIVFGVISYLLNSFIIEKINPIYKTIHNINIPDNVLHGDFSGKDIISEVKDEVIDWAKDKTQEINQLKQMEKYRKEFIGNVSHELKTPIFNIQGYVLTLLDGGLDDPTINRMYLQRTEKSINRMISIVEDLDIITRLESGELTLEKEHFNIIQLVEDVIENQEMIAKKKHLKLKIIGGGDRRIMVNADKKRIFEAVNNLIINSIIYGKESGTTTISFSEMGDNILIDITDDGIGIPEKDRARIFERFYRVDRSRSRRHGGTGLGLAIVKHIIEAHNQTINVRSTENKGSSFVFTLEKV